jgi:uncharacterized protein
VNSCLYECQVLHARFAPKAHRFLYRIFFFALDLDELDALHRRLKLFSVNRANFYSFRDRDFLPTGEPIHNGPAPATTPAGRLKARVIAHLAAQGTDLTGGRVVLVTLPRILGYLFNPVSFYFCFDRTGVPVAALAEVTNTFKEMKPYTLGPDTKTAAPTATFHLRTPKHFYVSPFSDVDVAFDFTLPVPTEKIAIQIDDYTGGTRTLTSTVHGRREALTDGRLAWYTLKYPLLTLRIITLIHWHALQLWFKKIPWFAKAARADAQRDLYRPHHSIANAPKA